MKILYTGKLLNFLFIYFARMWLVVESGFDVAGTKKGFYVQNNKGLHIKMLKTKGVTVVK